PSPDNYTLSLHDALPILLGNLSGAPLPVLLWAMYVDTADYGEWRSGRRTTALVFSASLMSQKIGWALAAFFALHMMSFAGFTARSEEHTSELQSREYLVC